MTGVFSWNLLADIADMWSYPGMVNAFRAGTIVAVLAGLVGWFMVLRRQSFAGHSLALVGFPGAAAAVWLGLGLAFGYFSFCLLAAVVIAALPQRAGRGYAEESAVVGTVQAFALASGMLFVAYYSPYPIGFWLTTIAFGLYALTYAAGAARSRLGARAGQPVPAGA